MNTKTSILLQKKFEEFYYEMTNYRIPESLSESAQYLRGFVGALYSIGAFDSKEQDFIENLNSGSERFLTLASEISRVYKLIRWGP